MNCRTCKLMSLRGGILTIWHALLAFTLAAGLLTITPGIDTALVLRTAAVEGPRRAIFASIGISCGCLAWGFAASVGLGSLLAVSQVAYKVLRVAGACYLVFLGTRMLLRKHPSAAEMDDAFSPQCARAPSAEPRLDGSFADCSQTCSTRRWAFSTLRSCRSLFRQESP